MAQPKITYDYLEGLQPDGRIHRIAYPGCRGLYFVMTPKGAQSWQVRAVLGKTRKTITRVIGAFGDPNLKLKEVIKLANKTIEQIRAGIDPNEVPQEKKEKPVTLREIWGCYLTDKRGMPKLQPSTQRNNQSIWDSKLDKPLKDLKIELPLRVEKLSDADVRTLDRVVVNLYLKAIAKDSPSVSNKAQALISKLFQWTRDNRTDLMDLPNPCEGREREHQPSRERHLEAHELPLFAQAWLKCVNPHKWMVLFCLLSGCRAGATIHYKPAYRTREDALQFPKRVPGLKKARYVVMPKVTRSLIDKFVPNIYHQKLETVCNWIEKKAGLAHFSTHDLRRTFESAGLELGMWEMAYYDLGGHGRGTVEDTYLVSHISVMLPAAEQICSHLMQQMGLKPEDLA